MQEYVGDSIGVCKAIQVIYDLTSFDLRVGLLDMVSGKSDASKSNVNLK